MELTLEQALLAAQSSAKTAPTVLQAAFEEANCLALVLRSNLVAYQITRIPVIEDTCVALWRAWHAEQVRVRNNYDFNSAIPSVLHVLDRQNAGQNTNIPNGTPYRTFRMHANTVDHILIRAVKSWHPDLPIGKLCKEVRRLIKQEIPGVVCESYKEGVDRFSIRLLHPDYYHGGVFEYITPREGVFEDGPNPYSRQTDTQSTPETPCERATEKR